MKNKKIMVILGSVLIVMVLAILLFPHFKTGYMGSTELVVIASGDIKKGTVITEDMIDQKEYPSAYLAEQTVVLLPEAIVGQYAAVDIYAGDVVNQAKIVAANEKVFFEQNNLIAITMANLSSSVAAKLAPGDLVNIYGYVKDTGSAGMLIEPPSLKNIEIAYVVASDAQEVVDGVAPAAVVVKVNSPEQAQELIKLEYSSKVHLERVSNNKEQSAPVATELPVVPPPATVEPPTDQQPVDPAL